MDANQPNITEKDDHDRLVALSERQRITASQVQELSELVATVAVLKDRSDNSRANIALWIALGSALLSAIQLLLKLVK